MEANEEEFVEADVVNVDEAEMPITDDVPSFNSFRR